MDACERVWIGLGGNVGDVAATLAAARAALAVLSTAPIVASPLYESAPWGVAGQANFFNQVAGLRPALGPRETLRALQAVEAALGRVRRERWGPRTIDLDLLCWPGLTLDAPDLTLPHPRLAERRFVLAPWADVAPDLVVPGLGRTVAALLADCSDASWVRRCS
jgi:2-amino-4-hydroxy-6-hydroxymethyldihydropteridine diphosphokinase